jgi:uncharacterized protein YukE
MGQPDVQMNIAHTMLASESLVQSAGKIGNRVEEFSSGLKAYIERWKSDAKEPAKKQLDDLVNAFGELTARCRATGDVIGQVANNMDEVERANLHRFGEA